MKKIYLLLLLVTACVGSVKSQCTFGNYPPTYTYNHGWTNGIWLAHKYTLPATATLTGLGLNTVGNSSSQFKMAIYDDAANAPGNLIASTAQSALVLGINEVSLATSTVLPAGDYWIAALFNSSSIPLGAASSTAGGLYLPGSILTPPASMSSWPNPVGYDLDYWAVINRPLVSISGPSHVCLGSTVNWTVTGASTYTWNSSINTATIDLSPAIDTDYSVKASGANGCTVTAAKSLSVLSLPVLSVSGNNTVCLGAAASLTLSGAATYSWSNGSATNVVSVSPGTTTTYTAYGFDANNCADTETLTVTVNSLPVLTVSGNTVLCAGETASLSFSGALTYSWSNGLTGDMVNLNPAVSTSYTVEGWDMNNCIGTETVTITVNALPVLAVSGNTTICAGAVSTLTVTGASTYSWSNGFTTTTVNLSPSVTTAYTVEGTDANNCADSETVTLTVNSLPVIQVSGTGTVCAGETVTLAVSGASSYSWSTGATASSLTLTPLSSSVISVEGFDANACKDMETVNVTVNAAPSLTVDILSAVLCEGESGTLTVTGATTYTWNNGSNVPALNVNPLSTTDYTVTGSNAAGCKSSVVVTQSVSTCTGFRAILENEVAASVFPNPFKDMFEVNMSSVSGNASCVIMNTKGEIIKNEKIVSESTTIDLSGYSSGLYYIVIRNNDKTRSFKLIRE